MPTNRAAESDTAVASKPFLDARIEAEKLRTRYLNDPRQSSFRLLLTGESGTGKTNLLRTARMPLHIDSFDPGGTLVLRDLIDSGKVIADTIYEEESRTDPQMFAEWQRNFEHRVRGKYFEAISTYALDSSTFWSDAIMNSVLKKAGIAGEAPRFTKDYVPQKVIIQNWLKRILSLPCDVVVTGHLTGEYESRIIEGEEVRILTGYKYMTTGQGAVIIPLMFDEQWTTLAEEKGTGTSYTVLTGKWRLYRARTRIGRDKFELHEKPDIKAMLRKAGWPVEDKPYLITK